MQYILFIQYVALSWAQYVLTTIIIWLFSLPSIPIVILDAYNVVMMRFCSTTLSTGTQYIEHVLLLPVHSKAAVVWCDVSFAFYTLCMMAWPDITEKTTGRPSS